MPNQGERRNSGPYRISNEVMGLPGATAGTVQIISSEGAKIAGREVAKKVTGKFITWLNIELAVIALGSLVNAATGKKGIEITLHEEYIKYFSQKDGYYIEGWDIKSVTVRRY